MGARDDRRRPPDVVADAGARSVRLRLLRLVRDEPGIASRNAAARLQLPLTLLHYHSARLAIAGLIVRMRVGRHVRLFPADLTHAFIADEMRLVQEPAARRIALAICETPGLHLRELLDRTRLSQRVVYFHLKRMRDADLVAAPSGQYLGLRPTPLLYIVLGALTQDAGRDDDEDHEPTPSRG